MMQDGAKHYLLCADCEQYLGVGENALSRISSARVASLERHGLAVEALGTSRWHVTGDRRNLIWRGLLGIALKYHYSPSAEATLPPATSIEGLRKAILQDDYSALFPPTGAKWFSFASTEGVNPRAATLVSFNRMLGVSGPPLMALMIGGITWFVPLTDEALGPEFGRGWVIECVDIRINALMFDDWEGVESHFEDRWMSASMGDPCPCGSGSVAATCCRKSWARSTEEEFGA